MNKKMKSENENNDEKMDGTTKPSYSTDDLERLCYCYCQDARYSKDYGKAMTSRKETKEVLDALYVGDRPDLAKVFGNGGPILVSDIPPSCTKQQQQEVQGQDKQRKTMKYGHKEDKIVNVERNGVIVGIDEAGRGSVFGPMVYGAAYWSESASDDIPKGFQDSKTLTEEQRSRLMDDHLLATTPPTTTTRTRTTARKMSKWTSSSSTSKHEENDSSNSRPPIMGFALRALLPAEISRNMFRPSSYNLNQMSHDTAFLLIHKLIQNGVNVTKCYVDTVGRPATYQSKLEREFPNIQFVVEPKADSKYAVCSAASVVAKVTRDRMLQGWKLAASTMDKNREFGSGYPSDPKCKAWMEELQDPLFGYCDLVRFSWAPVKDKLSSSSSSCTDSSSQEYDGTNNNKSKNSTASPVQVTFAADIDDDDNDNDEFLLSAKKCMSSFLKSGQKHGTKRKRSFYLEERRLRTVNKLF